MGEKKYEVALDLTEMNVVINTLNGFCKDHMEELNKTEAIDDVLEKLVHIQEKKEKRKHEHETR
jgi:hypothetical protein